MRFYDTKTRSETSVSSDTTIPSTDARVSNFFLPLQQGEKMIFGDDNLPYFYTEDFMIPTVVKGKVVESETDEQRVARLTLSYQDELMTLCDTKQNDVEKLILGYKATPKQIERYKDKYERAKSGEFDIATNEVIIAKYEAMLVKIRGFIDLIEKFRGGVDDMITAGELDRARVALDAGKNFDASTTITDINAVLTAVASGVYI